MTTICGAPNLQEFVCIFCPGMPGVRGNEIAVNLASQTPIAGVLITGVAKILWGIRHTLFRSETTIEKTSTTTIGAVAMNTESVARTAGGEGRNVWPINVHRKKVTFPPFGICYQ